MSRTIRSISLKPRKKYKRTRITQQLIKESLDYDYNDL